MKSIMKIGIHYLFPLVAVLFLMTAACSKKGDMSFCEGVDTDGKGINCGKVFSTGDLTAVFEVKDNFGTDTLTLKVFNEADGDRKPEQTVSVKVKSDENKGRAELEMYDEGQFNVVIEKKGEPVAEGKIEIIDSVNRR
jgi:hypothetical protein